MRYGRTVYDQSVSLNQDNGIMSLTTTSLRNQDL